MACQYPASPGSRALQEESSCSLHCKIVRGQLLGYSQGKQLLLQLPEVLCTACARGSSICCSHPLSFTGHSGEEPAAGKVAVWEVVSGFPLFLPPHGLSTTVSEDTQHFQYLQWGRATSPCHAEVHKTTGHPGKTAVAEPAQKCLRCPRKGAVSRKRAPQDIPSFFHHP